MTRTDGNTTTPVPTSSEDCKLTPVNCAALKNKSVYIHVRKLADLKKRWGGRREKPEWVKRMIAMQRKTLIVCHSCHVAIHAGRPTPSKREEVPESRVRSKVQARFGGANSENGCTLTNSPASSPQ